MVTSMLGDNFCPAAHFSMENFQTSQKAFDLNDIWQGSKMTFSVTFQKCGPVAPNCMTLVFDDII